MRAQLIYNTYYLRPFLSFGVSIKSRTKQKQQNQNAQEKKIIKLILSRSHFKMHNHIWLVSIFIYVISAYFLLLLTVYMKSVRRIYKVIHLLQMNYNERVRKKN